MADKHNEDARAALIASGALLGAAMGGLPGAVVGSLIGYVASGAKRRF